MDFCACVIIEEGSNCMGKHSNDSQGRRVNYQICRAFLASIFHRRVGVYCAEYEERTRRNLARDLNNFTSDFVSRSPFKYLFNFYPR